MTKKGYIAAEAPEMATERHAGQWRASWLWWLIIALCVALSGVCIALLRAAREGTKGAGEGKLLLVSCKYGGGMIAPERSWELVLRENGLGKIKYRDGAALTLPRKLVFSEITRIEKLLTDCEIEHLPDEIGKPVVDQGFETILIESSKTRRTITIWNDEPEDVEAGGLCVLRLWWALKTIKDSTKRVERPEAKGG
jgi:hypothetical protein